MPEAVLLDTSVVVDALVRAQPRHEVCRDFLARAAESGTTVLYNELLETELSEALFRLGLGKSWRNARHDGRRRRTANRLMLSGLRAWRQVLSGLNFAWVSLEDIRSEAIDLMRWGLGSNDAVHVATALEFEVDHIATLDYGFAHVPISRATLLVPPTQLREFRKRRARR
jgi:predicted nucleic acid-binding protein